MTLFSRFPLTRGLAVGALVAGLASPVALSTTAQAQGWNHWHGGGGGWHGGGWHGGGGYYGGPGPGVAIASGLLGLAVGAAVGGALVGPPGPVYAAPPPVVYTPPPVYYAAPPPPVYYAAPPPPTYYAAPQPPAYYVP